MIDGIEIRLLGPHDAGVLDRVAPDVFDAAIHPRWRAEFLSDPRHHLVVAIDDGQIVGMATGVHYVHPDKPPELWINEVGVAPTHRRRGIGRALLGALLAHARARLPRSMARHRCGQYRGAAPVPGGGMP